MENKRDRHFTEEEIKDKIVQSAEGMEVPDSLKPENIEKKLAQKKKKRTPVYGIVAAAACCCLVVGAVAFSGRGMMQDKEAQKAAEKTADDTVAESTAALASAKDYDQIYEYVQAAAEEEEIMYGTGGADGAALYTGEKAVADQAVSHSDTNVRTEGVGEGDIVKTDGKYLYIMSMDKVQILNIESEEMKQAGTISMDANDYLIEIYLKDDKLVCVYARTTLPLGIYLGDFGSSLFFIVSGASLALTVPAEQNPAQFYKRRARAVYPLFWLAWFVVFSYRFVAHPGSFGGARTVTLVLTLLGLDNFAVAAGWVGTDFACVGEWFLGSILFLYLLFPLLQRGLA